MPTKKEKNARLAEEAFRSVFEGSRVEGRMPNILKPSSTPSTQKPSEKTERPARKTGLYLNLPQRGFIHPVHGHFITMPKQFKAILALEKKSITQVVYEIIEQTVGWEDPRGLHGRREWAQLSLRHFQRECAMSLSQVQSGLKEALNRGYIRRRGRMGEYEYAVRWADEDEHDNVLPRLGST